MRSERYTVQGTGQFSHIAAIRRFGAIVVETWLGTSEDHDFHRKGVQAKAELARRIEQFRAAGCIVTPA